MVQTPHDLLYEAKRLTTEKKYAEAIQVYDRVLEIDPESVKAWYFKTLLYKTLKQHDEAERCGKRTIELNPKWTSKIKEILSTTTESKQKKKRLAKTREEWTKEDEFLDRLYRVMFIEEAQMFDDRNWYQRLGMQTERSRRNQRSVHLILERIAELKGMQDVHFKKLFDYSVQAFVRGYTFYYDKHRFAEKVSHALAATGFQADTSRFGHIINDPATQVTAQIYSSFIEQIAGNDERVVFIDRGTAALRYSWYSRLGMFGLTKDDLYTVGPCGFHSEGDTSVLMSNDPWKPYHRHVDVYPLNLLDSHGIFMDKKERLCLTLNFQNIPFHMLKRESQKQFGGGYKTKIRHKNKIGNISLDLWFHKYPEDNEYSLKIRATEFARVIDSLRHKTIDIA